MRGEILRDGGGVGLLQKKKKKRRLQIASGEEGERGGVLKKRDSNCPSVCLFPNGFSEWPSKNNNKTKTLLQTSTYLRPQVLIL